MGSLLDAELVERIRAAVSQAPTANEAVARIVSGLPTELDISRVGLRVEDAKLNEIRVAAVWSKWPTDMEAGMTHPTTGTIAENYMTTARSRRSSVRIVRRDPFLPPPLREILSDEGNASGVLIPLLVGDDVPAVLAILSGSEDRFPEEDLDFYDRLGVALAGPLLTLAEREGS